MEKIGIRLYLQRNTGQTNFYYNNVDFIFLRLYGCSINKFFKNNMKKKFAVILSGCGSKDGSEIHEATMLLLAIKQNNAGYQCFSIDEEQKMVVNFITGERMNEKRNVLIESARIARGSIKKIDKLNVDEFDAIVLPGGLGAVLNLSTYALDNDNYTVNGKLKDKLIQFRQKNKVICAACIAPMILAKVFKNITITLGNDQAIKNAVEKLGNRFQNTDSGKICIDKANKIITAPFYMLANNIATIYDEASLVIKSALELG